MSAQQKSIKEALETASTALTPVAGEEARLESELLLSEALEKTRSHLFAWPEQALPPDQLDQFDALIEQRLSGRPIAYILGKREFWSLELRVTQDTLIPRPETETLVERALELI
ncbi:MAG: protein-(glutamine-N5) methyltransferase, release factor-specific, partial [Sedimenticola sp.]